MARPLLAAAPGDRTSGTARALIGTIINVVAVTGGGTAGLLLGNRLPARIQTTVFQGLGLATLFLGVKNALQSSNLLILLGAIVIGGALGEVLRVQDRLDQFGHVVQRGIGRLGRRHASTGGAPSASGHRFSRGFVTASLLFCVGPLTILGTFQDGLTGDYSILAVKSLLDGTSAFIFASSLGAGVPAAALFVLVYQGALTLAAGILQPLLTNAMIVELTAVGGLLMLGLGLSMLEIKQVRVASFLPALVVAPLLVPLAGWIVSAVGR